MPNRKYFFEKRQKELAKKQKREEKQQRKRERTEIPSGEEPTSAESGEGAHRSDP